MRHRWKEQPNGDFLCEHCMARKGLVKIGKPLKEKFVLRYTQDGDNLDSALRSGHLLQGLPRCRGPK